ncbi:MAG: Asp-tRNA(Asn)/Glu-tRNA(Gln) amidotransferase subunit GatA [Candidatus Moranbacteria bacterium]|nr:Asp-tRNA(Asn)/Glu-tRNA(Gln) amidotransferase subunit GatA [Candidatus Moranbacteria bacterium]
MNLTITQALQKLKKQELTSVALTRKCLARIEKYEKAPYKVNAIITVNKEQALEQARKSDQKRKNNQKLGELEGIPIAVKDVIATRGLRTTAASKILDNFIPTYDATVVKNLKKQGAVIIAKTNCDEFAHGASGENSAYGPTKNPYDLERVAGGSSSGSGAIVVYGGALGAVGTDTGGSVRAPASFMNLVGVKPNYGRTSRYGLLAMSSSTDVVSPIAQNCSDAALMLKAMSAKDPKDSTSAGFAGKSFDREFNKPLKNYKFAYPKQVYQKGLDPEIKTIFMQGLELLKSQGAQIQEIDIQTFGEPAVAAYYILVPSEISSNLARYDGIKYGMTAKQAKNLEQVYTQSRSQYLGQETKRRVMLGNFALSAGYYDAYYKKAQQVRAKIKHNAGKIFAKYDLILTPTMASAAFKMGAKNDPLSMYLADVYVNYASLAGLPALSINAGWLKNNPKQAIVDQKALPVGLQMVSNWWDEENLLGAAYQFEKLIALQQTVAR